MRKGKPHSYRVLNLDYDTISELVSKDKYYNTIRKTKNDNYNWWQSVSECNTTISHYYEYSRKDTNNLHPLQGQWR